MNINPGAIQIFVSDIERAKEWFSSVLGMKTIQEYPDIQCILMSLGSAEYDIGVPGESWGEGWNKVRIGGRTPIFFETPNIESAVKELKEKEVKIVEEPHIRPWGELKSVFADPDGNEFSLIEVK